MSMYKFSLTGKRAGQTLTLLDRYAFVDGDLVVTAKVARQIRPILVDFYACEMTKVEAEASDPQSPPAGDPLEEVDPESTVPPDAQQ